MAEVKLPIQNSRTSMPRKEMTLTWKLAHWSLFRDDWNRLDPRENCLNICENLIWIKSSMKIINARLTLRRGMAATRFTRSCSNQLFLRTRKLNHPRNWRKNDWNDQNRVNVMHRWSPHHHSSFSTNHDQLWETGAKCFLILLIDGLLISHSSFLAAWQSISIELK